MSKKAIIYARFSSAEQSKGFSLERQQTLGREYALKNKWTVEASLADEGRSAFHGANRIEGSSLHQFELEARNGLHTGKVLVVENINRLSRQGAKAAAQLIWALNSQGVDVATYHDKVTYNAGSSGDMMELFGLIVKAQLAHEESLAKSRLSTASWNKKYKLIAENDRTVPINRLPGWLDQTPDGYELNQHRAAVLNEIYDLYVSGVGIYRIVSILNDRKEPTWSGCNDRNGGWFLAYVHRLLTHRGVLGEYVTLKGETVSPDYFPQAITTDKFLRAQAIRTGKQKTGGRDHNKASNLLSGMVVCSVCEGKAGYQYRVPSKRSYTTKSGEARTYEVQASEHLRCDRYRRKHDCKNSVIVNYKVVETAVIDQLLAVAFADVPDDGKANQFDIQIAETIRHIEHTTQRLNNLYDQVEDGIKGLGDRIEQRQLELDTLNAKLKEQHETRAVETAKPSSFDDAALIASLRDDLNSADADIRFYARTRTNAALKRIVEQITICPDGTFIVEADIAVWEFNSDGKVIGGQAL